jgi:predicted dithiol-disulfide oxidoreductase (DUF899 family)
LRRASGQRRPPPAGRTQRHAALDYASTSAKLADHRRQIAATRQKMRAAQEAGEPQDVTDYAFATLRGPVRLSQLFSDNADHFLIHDMGAHPQHGRCVARLHAMGRRLNGIYHHLADQLLALKWKPGVTDSICVNGLDV